MARKIQTKVCTFTRESYPATPEFFYRDKSQKDGLSPWSKIGEKAYNDAYHRALKTLGVTRVRDLDDASRVKFDNAMKRAKVRIAQTGRVNRDATTTKKAATSRKRTQRAKATA